MKFPEEKMIIAQFVVNYVIARILRVATIYGLATRSKIKRSIWKQIEANVFEQSLCTKKFETINFHNGLVDLIGHSITANRLSLMN